MFDNTKILLIGGGRMGGALLAGWIKAGFNPDTIIVVEPDAALRTNLEQKFDVRGVERAGAIDFGFLPAVAVLAIKPQAMDEVLERYAKFNWQGTLYLSIAAGKTIASVKRYMGAATPVVRGMPNLPATIGKGVSVATASSEVDNFQKELSTALLKAAGEVIWTDKEDMLDAVTAISGSGPAYVYYFIEAFAEAGRKVGLDEATAKQLAVATVHGSVALLEEQKGEAADLRKAVTSPGGTTEAALKVLMDEGQGLKPLLVKAVEQAKKRAGELSS